VTPEYVVRCPHCAEPVAHTVQLRISELPVMDDTDPEVTR